MPAGAVSTGYWDSVDRHTDLSEIWMSHPIVRRRINLRISGDQDVWPTVWLGRRLQDRLPLQRTVSIGCGIGNFERDVVGQGLVEQIIGVDESAACVAEAIELARKSGIESRVAYHCGDARAWLRSATGLDAVFFHQSLHHFDRLDELLSLVAGALRPGGVLYLDEFVGPARDEWRLRHLLVHNLAYRLLPRPVHRPRLIRAPINRQDPTEAINSSQILTSVKKHFDILERRDYGGNLVSVIYPNLRRPDEAPGSDPEEFDRAITFLLDLEEWCLRNPRLTGAKPYYTTVIAVPRTPASAG